MSGGEALSASEVGGETQSAPAVQPRGRRDSSLLLIRPRRPGLIPRLREFWAYRRLLGYFAKRNLQQRYARTFLGWIWVPLRPAVQVLTSVLVFGGVLGVATGKTPYLIFFLVTSTAWQFFSQTAYYATRSIQMNGSLLKRFYVPRLIPMAASVTYPLVDYLIYLTMAALAVVFYLVKDGTLYFNLGLGTIVFFLGVGLLALQGITIGLWLAPLATVFRDVRFGLRYVLGFWHILTPVIYPLSAVPSSYRTLASLNPITAPVEMMKYGFFRGGEVTAPSVASSLSITFVALIGGLWFFARKEALAVDYL